MTDRIGIHWFRLDLRLNDNPALYELSKEVDKIIPIYDHVIVDESQDFGTTELEIVKKRLYFFNTRFRAFKISSFRFSNWSVSMA